MTDLAKKGRAMELRRMGKTYGQIVSELGVSKGTLSGWLRNEEWPKEITKRWAETEGKSQLSLMYAGKKLSMQARRQRATEEALVDFEKYWPNPLFVAGLALYWGEGDKKTAYQARLTNTDPELIRIFLSFLLTFGDLPKERVWVSLIIYDDLDVSTCELFWQKATNLSADHFQKTVMIKGRSIEKRSPNGICVLGISSVDLKTKMLVWIAELSKRL